ncbi:MAG: ribosome silencing factor [Planctomycetota bacterium]|jgi:ribosome-associated protein
MAFAAAEILDSRQATDIRILDVSGPLAIADYFVIATARNRRHAQALANELSMGMKSRACPRLNTAGMEGESGWILLDFDEVVVHCFLEETREFYSLESLWADVPQLPFTPSFTAEAGAPQPGIPQGRNPAGYPEAGFSGQGERPPEFPSS